MSIAPCKYIFLHPINNYSFDFLQKERSINFLFSFDFSSRIFQQKILSREGYPMFFDRDKFPNLKFLPFTFPSSSLEMDIVKHFPFRFFFFYPPARRV